MMSNKSIRELLEAYQAGTIQPDDFDELRAFLATKSDEEIASYMDMALETMESDEDLAVTSDSLYNRIIRHPDFSSGSSTIVPISSRRPVMLFSWKWISGIAAILVAGTAWFLFQKKNPVPVFNSRQEVTQHLQSSLSKEKKDQPVLKLANGTVISLDSAANGLLATQGHTQIVLNGDELSYQSTDQTDSLQTASNSIITPKGRQYQIRLPDGTKVWLNAATTLTYPVRFTADKRIVELEGEAYFEVAANKKQPFIVRSNSQEINVLGTSFNISSYADDSETRTTLVNGRVLVTNLAASDNQHASSILNPGQQAVSKNNSSRLITRQVNTDQVIAWKQGVFVFNNEEIKDVLKKVSRWYDIEIVYRDGMEGKRIGGTVVQFKDVNQLMQALQTTGLLRYKMEGGKIVIMK